MRDKLSLHFLGLRAAMKLLLLVASPLAALLERELVDCLAWTALDEVASE